MSQTSSKHGRAPRRGTGHHEDACPTCGTLMKAARGRLKLPINGEEVAVPSASHLKCPKCGEIVLGLQDAKRLHEDAVALYRRKHGLLSASEIRAIRERFDLNQAELARLLRLGANTVSRWESGRNVQIAAMDTLLRMIRDVPGSLDYLRPRRMKAAPPRLKSRGPRTTKIAS